MRLEEVVQLALAKSNVIRDLGGAVLRTPSAVETHWDPAIRETDPRYGVDAALSAFDAQFAASAFGEKNSRAINNQFFGGGTRELRQDVAALQAQLTKRAATGTEFTFSHNVDYDSNNAPGNLFRSAWNVNIETEFRHPLLQGGGVEFNRIAGPSQVPGVYNGVLIARVNTDVELADFEIAVRDLVSDVENTYWELYFAYRDLDAKIKARDAALDTWRRIHALYEGGPARRRGRKRGPGPRAVLPLPGRGSKRPVGSADRHRPDGQRQRRRHVPRHRRGAGCRASLAAAHRAPPERRASAPTLGGTALCAGGLRLDQHLHRDGGAPPRTPQATL